MNLTKLEQETIILFNEGEPNAEVYTHNGKWKRRLGQLSIEFPAEVTLVKGNPHAGAVTYSLPKSLVSVRKPMSEETREAARERARTTNLRPPSRDKSPSQTTEEEQ